MQNTPYSHWPDLPENGKADTFEAFAIFSRQQDTAAAQRELGTFRQPSAVENLSKPERNYDLRYKKIFKNLQGRMFEAPDMTEEEFFGILCYANTLNSPDYDAIHKAVRAFAFNEHNENAWRALARCGDMAAQAALESRQQTKAAFAGVEVQTLPVRMSQPGVVRAPEILS